MAATQGTIFGIHLHMIARTTLAFALLIAIDVSGQGRFPVMAGETAEGHAVSLPPSGGEGYAVIALAYGSGAQADLEAWYEPAYLRFVAKHGLFAGSYSCNVWFVPVFTGLNKAAYDPSMRKLLKSAEPEMVDHVLFFKGDFDPIQAQLGLKRSDIPYFFVIDGHGTIVHRTEGAFSDEKLDAMEEVMME